MAILIEVKTKSGKIRRCCAKCYNAKYPKCVCVCGGVNHSAGLKKAVENIKEGKVEPLDIMRNSNARSYNATFHHSL